MIGLANRISRRSITMFEKYCYAGEMCDNSGIASERYFPSFVRPVIAGPRNEELLRLPNNERNDCIALVELSLYSAMSVIRQVLSFLSTIRKHRKEFVILAKAYSSNIFDLHKTQIWVTLITETIRNQHGQTSEQGTSEN